MWLAALLFSFVQAETLSTTVGRIDDHIVTSREVQMDHIIEQAQFGGIKTPTNLPLDSKAFTLAINDVLLERALALEAKSFDVVQIKPKDLESAAAHLEGLLKNDPGWSLLEPEPTEWRAVLERKLKAKEFVRFRRDSSQLPVTDAEAKRYFEENRGRFGTLPFENFSENIKSYLTRSQVDRRIKDWYEVLKSKYKTKNFLSEL